MSRRIYIVTNTITGAKHLVKAGSQSQALNLLARELLEVVIARPVQVAELLTAGAPLLDPDTQPE